jgi:ABC-type uncharacterized transport system involved in gliding motility auxiliary subunit
MPTGWGPDLKLTPRSHKQMQLAGASYVVLVLIVAGLVLWLSKLYYFEADLTLNGRNSLSPATLAVLQKMDKPLHVTAYANLHGEQRLGIQKLLDAYKRYKRDIDLVFVDPDEQPQQTRKAGIQYDGQLVLEYDGAKKMLAQLNEESLTNTLTQLGHKGERWILFVSGHGERSPDRGANFDVSNWVRQLRQRGFQTRSLSLAENPTIPGNTSVLVVAGPQSQLLKGEVQAITHFVNTGGHLLWLHEPGSLWGLGSVGEQLEIEFHPGMIVDPLSQMLTGSATAIVVGKYSSHPIVKNFIDNTVFPTACGIGLANTSKWKQSVLLDTRESAWSETGPLNAKARRDKGIDVPGPLNIGVALTREVEQKEQRVVVICDGDFLSNSFLANAGNLELGMSVINWLSHDDAYVNIPVQTVADAKLNLSATSQNIMMAIFVVIMPVALIVIGLVIWLRRRRR